VKKRLRKKLRIKEFFEPYIAIKGTFETILSNKQMDCFIDEICSIIDSNNATFGGGCNPETFEYVISQRGKYYKNRLTNMQIDKIVIDIVNQSFIKAIEYKIIACEEDEIKYLKEE